jgi:sulfate transport system permease protein
MSRTISSDSRRRPPHATRGRPPSGRCDPLDADRRRRRLLAAGSWCCRWSLVFVEAFRKGGGRLFRLVRRSRHAGRHPLTLLVAAIAVPLNLVFGVAAAWASPSSSSRARLPDHADRPAVLGLAGHFGPGLCAAVRRAELLGPWLKARHRDHLRRAGHRAGDDLRHLPLRRARTDPADAGAGHGDEEAALSLGASGWQTFWRDAAQYQMGPALRRAALQRARHGRVRRGVGGLRPHPRQDQHDAAACRDPLQRVQFRQAAFAVASLLALLALVTLVFKTVCSSSASAMNSPAHAVTNRPREDLPWISASKTSARNFDRYPALQRRVARHPLGRTDRAARPLGLGQDDAAAAHRRARNADRRQIFFGDEDASHRTVQERNVGFVFQHYALFRT